jgi:cytoskeletal protein CcmA (bactofilin family)
MADSPITDLEESSLESESGDASQLASPSGSSTPPEYPSGAGLPKFLPPRAVLLIAILVMGLIVCGVVIAVLSKPAKKADTTVIVNTQSLDNGTLNRLTSQLGTNTTVQQQLTISPSTLFKNNIEVQGTATVDKDLTVKGTSTLLGAVTAGSSLAVHGALSVGGSTNLAGNLSVGGLLTAASLNVGSISNSTINLSGNLNLGGHLVPSGTAPHVVPSVAASGGTTTISGNDTAGTVTITVGNGLVQSGEMAIITFNKAFNLTPKVQLTPANEAAANLRYFVTQSPTFFTVRASNTPANGVQYQFNYFTTD